MSLLFPLHPTVSHANFMSTGLHPFPLNISHGQHLPADPSPVHPRPSSGTPFPSNLLGVETISVVFGLEWGFG